MTLSRLFQGAMPPERHLLNKVFAADLFPVPPCSRNSASCVSKNLAALLDRYEVVDDTDRCRATVLPQSSTSAREGLGRVLF